MVGIFLNHNPYTVGNLPTSNAPVRYILYSSTSLARWFPSHILITLHTAVRFIRRITNRTLGQTCDKRGLWYAQFTCFYTENSFCCLLGTCNVLLTIISTKGQYWDRLLESHLSPITLSKTSASTISHLPYRPMSKERLQQPPAVW